MCLTLTVVLIASIGIHSYFCPLKNPLGPYLFSSATFPNRSPFKQPSVSVMPLQGGVCLWLHEPNATHGISFHIPG